MSGKNLLGGQTGPITQHQKKRGRTIAICEQCRQEFSRENAMKRRFCSVRCKVESQRKPSTFKLEGEVAIIDSTRGKQVIIDLSDIDLVAQSWHATPNNNETLWYANTMAAYTHKTVKMHRVIMERMLGRQLSSTEIIDHINGNGLDNRRSNLRLASNSNNNANARKHAKTTSSHFKGVSFHIRTKKWCARIHVRGRMLQLGSFSSEIRAAEAYDRAARRYFGEFANTNFGEVC